MPSALARPIIGGIIILNNKRILLKSPTHSFRINLLLEMFPKAKFVCLYRNPYNVYSSTRHLWTKLLANNKLQERELYDLHELILTRYIKLFNKLESDKRLIPSGQYYELRFEDLENEPIKTMNQIYSELDLGDFTHLRLILEQYIKKQGNYKKNVYFLSEKTKKVIAENWGPAFRAYGYES